MLPAELMLPRLQALLILEHSTDRTPPTAMGTNGSPKISSTTSGPSDSAPHSSTQTIVQGPTLLSIPPELRNEVYTYVLVANSDIEIPTSGRLSSPSLLQVCQQITSEASAIYYGQNSFSATVDPSFAGPRDWMTHTSNKATKSIKSITLQYCVSDDVHELNRRFVRVMIEGDVEAVDQNSSERGQAWKKGLTDSANSLLELTTLIDIPPRGVRFHSPAEPDDGRDGNDPMPSPTTPDGQVFVEEMSTRMDVQMQELWAKCMRAGADGQMQDLWTKRMRAAVDGHRVGT